MTNHYSAAICLGVLVSSSSVASDLYRCDLPDRRVEYQGTQCAIGVRQKAIDPANAKREQAQRTLEQKRKQQQKSAAATTAG